MSGTRYEARQVIYPLLLVLGGATVLLGMGIFLFNLFKAMPSRTAYLGVVGGLLLPVGFILGGLVLLAVTAINKRSSRAMSQVVEQKDFARAAFTVLVIDDDWSIVRLIKYSLENKDIRVIPAQSGLDGLKMLQQGGVDLVLLDVGLPDFDGWGILSLLRFSQLMRDIPVILISVRPPDQNLLRQLEPAGYIQKPFDVREVAKRVRNIIEVKYQ